MSSLRKTRNWLCVAALAAAFWITFRVVTAVATPMPVQPVVQEVEDPALERLIAGFANAARARAAQTAPR